MGSTTPIYSIKELTGETDRRKTWTCLEAITKKISEKLSTSLRIKSLPIKLSVPPLRSKTLLSQMDFSEERT